MKKGLHIISNFFNCSKNQKLLVEKSELEKILTSIIKQNDLTILKKSFYKFKRGGITGFVLLSESHVSLHTWPERGNYIALDIYVCNYNKDNNPKAQNIFKRLLDLFKPRKIEKFFIKRQ